MARRSAFSRDSVRRSNGGGGGGGGFPGFGAGIVDVDTDPNDAGVSALAARADHKHDVVTAVPSGDVDIGDAASEGTALGVARADHQHAVPAPGAAPPAVGTGAVGVATTPARSDHTHDGVGDLDGLTGAVDIVSPMKTISGQEIRIDNGNVKTLSDAATVTGITTDTHNSFFLESALGRTIGAPTNTRNPDGQKITFTFKKDTNSAIHHTFDGSAYAFSSTLITLTGTGIRKADFDAFYDAMIQGQYMKIGFEYLDDYGFWVAVAMAGPWPTTPE